MRAPYRAAEEHSPVFCLSVRCALRRRFIRPRRSLSNCWDDQAGLRSLALGKNRITPPPVRSKHKAGLTITFSRRTAISLYLTHSLLPPPLSLSLSPCSPHAPLLTVGPTCAIRRPTARTFVLNPERVSSF